MKNEISSDAIKKNDDDKILNSAVDDDLLRYHLHINCTIKFREVHTAAYFYICE